MKGLYLIIGSVVIAVGILYFAFGPRPEIKFGGRGTFEEGTSGIMGEARLGPTCPGARIEPGDDGCADKLYQGEFELMDATGSRVVKRFSTNAKGEFKITVEPGEYMIRNKDTGQPFPTCGKSGVVPVSPNEFSEVIVFCDTGIR